MWKQMKRKNWQKYKISLTKSWQPDVLHVFFFYWTFNQTRERSHMLWFSGQETIKVEMDLKVETFWLYYLLNLIDCISVRRWDVLQTDRSEEPSETQAGHFIHHVFFFYSKAQKQF